MIPARWRWRKRYSERVRQQDTGGPPGPRLAWIRTPQSGIRLRPSQQHMSDPTTRLTDRSAATSPTSPAGTVLPVQLTTFVGREREVAELRALIPQARLITLTGAGGSGKTRLAYEVAAQVGRESGVPVRAVELAPLSDSALLPQAVAEQLGIVQDGGSATGALLDSLRDQQLLLVLDNCEHVVEECARLTESLLLGCPDLRILATSREALGISGERAWLVPPLSLTPTEDAAPDRDGDTDAVRLFVARAREVVPAFSLTAANASAVADICRRLDGLPLAIELAAARVRVLAPEQILEHLHDRFRLLTSGRRSGLPRQQTLRATIDWSFDLLTPSVKTLLERLAVFRGSFTLGSVQSICTDDEIAPGDVLDLLTRLVDRSLVVLQEARGTARFVLLESIREYSAERLANGGDEHRLRNRHARFYAELVAVAEPHLITPARPLWAPRIQEDLDNVRQALAWTGEMDPDLHLRLNSMLCWYWFATGHWSEGRRWAEHALSLPTARSAEDARAGALFTAGMIAALQADTESAAARLERSAQLAREAGDARLEAYALNYLGMALIQKGDGAGEAPTLRALDWFRANGDLYGARLSLLLLGSLAAARGELEQAAALCEEAVEVAREFGLPRELGISLQLLGSWRLQQGRVMEARGLFHESLVRLRDDPQHLFIARGMEMLGVVACEMGDTASALRLWGAGASVRRKIGAGSFQTDLDRLRPRLDAVRDTVGAETFERLWSEGEEMPTPSALEQAIAWAGSPAGGTESVPLEAADPPRTVDSAVQLSVRALGPLELVWRGAGIPASGSLRPFELLVYLLCHPRGRTREQVGADFWPESSAGQVKNSFHVLLHRLRGVLGETEVVIRDGDRYRVNPELDVWFDADLFRREICAALSATSRGEDTLDRLDVGLALYRGDFLEGMAVGDWHLPVRDELGRLFADGLSGLAELQMARGDFPGASATLQRLVARENLREDAVRRLMICYAQSGQRTRAIQQYETLVRLLSVELDTVPEEETRDLAERIRAGGAD